MGIKPIHLPSLILGFVIFGCAGASTGSFPYRYYGLAAEHYEGKMLGDKPENDLDLVSCKPTQNDAAPCAALPMATMLKIKADYLDLQNKLIQCQKDLQAELEK